MTVEIIDLYAVWCGPCKVVAPILDKIAEELKVKLTKIDVDSNPEAVKKYNIRSVPTIVIEKNGVELNRIVKVSSGFEKTIREAIQVAFENE